MKENENIFEISINWVQAEAKRLIGRRLTYDEIYSVKKGIEAGLLFDIDTVLEATIGSVAEFK
ncbi:MAG: hypothetical protein K8R67_00435 [Desulfobacteraceae bacterium]|nr:hypothetical protein [Desulfobacteraceae bacterium]